MTQENTKIKSEEGHGFECSSEPSEAWEISGDQQAGAMAEDNALYKDLSSTQWPIVYHKDYNISFLGLQRLHPFDAGKWGRIVGFLKESDVFTSKHFIFPTEPNEEQLKQVHSAEYLNSLKWSWKVAVVTEVPPVAVVPNFILQRVVLNPLRLQTGGTILAAKLALEHGWAINIGGGFHHCHSNDGGGFCAYADITLSIHFLLEAFKSVSKVMIIDLDAHQGNGHERDFMGDDAVYIMDVYNSHIYPGDTYAKDAIQKKVELQHWTGDDTYLSLVKSNMEEAINEFHPDIIVYNAGTDILEGDPLGRLSITDKGILERDEMVFQAARDRNIPIFMLTSGGYQKRTARIIADSILNLHKKGLISHNNSES